MGFLAGLIWKLVVVLLIVLVVVVVATGYKKIGRASCRERV